MLDDDAIEGDDETFTVELSDANGATIVDAEGVGTITDDDVEEPPPGQPTLRIGNVRVAENEGPAEFTVTLSEVSAQEVTVNYETSDGTARAVLDYTTESGTLTIAAGDTTGTISVAVRNDEVVEGDERFTVTLSGAVNATIADGEGRGVIEDDDGTTPPRGHSTLRIDDVTVSEGDGDAVFTVTLSRAAGPGVTVSYRTVDGTATAGSDYEPAKKKTLKFGAGIYQLTISVGVLDDEAVESDETFAVTLSDALNATIVDGEGVGTITDDDGVEPPPELPTLEIDDVTVAEGGGPAEFTVELSTASEQDVTVEYATADGTALAGLDYTAASGTLTIDAGETTGTIAVEVLDDGVVEGEDETFTVELSAPSGATIEDGEGVGTITDDDAVEPPPELPTLEIDDVTVSENEGSAEFTVTLSASSTGDVTVKYATSDGTARAGQDYTGVVSRTLTIAAGTASGTISVRVLDDEYFEGNETFTVTLSDAVNATIDDGEGVGTITDDEVEVTVSFAESAYTVTEGSSVSVTVALSEAPGRSVVVPLTHTPDGAGASDYSGVPDSVSFASSETRRSFSVTALEDTERDDGESVTLGFGTLPSGVVPGDPGTATITIVDATPPADPTRNEWLRRFGGTSAIHVLEALDDRIRRAQVRRSAPGVGEPAQSRRGHEPADDEPMSLVVAGRRVPISQSPSAASAHWSATDGSSDSGMSDGWSFDGRASRADRELTAKEVLSRSTFQFLSQSPGDSQQFSFWGQGALSHFDNDGIENELDGDVLSATLGVDYADLGVLAGIALSHSEGDGSFLQDGVDYDAASTLTGLYPYVYVGTDARVSVWGTAGFGSGTFTVGAENLDVETDVDARMGAVGVRREILRPIDHMGLSLALKADALLMRIDSDEAPGLEATRNLVSRQRLGMEVSQGFTLADGEWIAPFFEVGARRDGGGAETALFVEVSGGFSYEYPAHGLTAEFYAHGLIPRMADRVAELGVSGSLRYNPMRRSQLGPDFSMSISPGGEGWTDSGRLWGRDILGDWGTDDIDAADPRMDAEFGYGIPIMGGKATGTPWLGASYSERWRDLRLGYRLGFGPDVKMGIDGRLRRDATGEKPSDVAVMLRALFR